MRASAAISQRGAGNYNPVTRRFASDQSDLFAPTAPPPAPPMHPPLEELNALLADLRGADTLPRTDLPATIAAEYRILGLARLAGDEGASLATEILNETERLFAAAEAESAR